jgi:hypothetical protein
MLRIVVLLLLVANLLYFGWSFFVGSDEPQLQAVTLGPRTAPLPPPPKPPCATLGPFTDELQIVQVHGQLEAAGWGVTTRDVTQQVADGFWVTVDNLENAVQQIRVLNAIKRAGIQDAFAMPDDPAFRVSVGIFTDRVRAEARARQVKRLNLEAQVNDRMRDVAALWLDVPGVAPAALDARLATAGIVPDGFSVQTCP